MFVGEHGFFDANHLQSVLELQVAVDEIVLLEAPQPSRISRARTEPTPSTASRSRWLARMTASRDSEVADDVADDRVREPRDAARAPGSRAADRQVERVGVARIAEELGQLLELEQPLVRELGERLEHAASTAPVARAS